MIEQLLAYNTLVVVAGVAPLGAAAGLIGSFAVLRKQSLTGDAIAHAALPGVCTGFLLAGERSLPLMLLGALVSGILGMVVISLLGRFTRVKQDSAIGVVLSVFPGLGFVMMRMIQSHGETGSQAGLESFIFGATARMTRGDVYWILSAGGICAALILLLYKELKVVSFDGGFARSLGWPVLALDLALTSAIALTVVIGLSSVGVVMMAALLILPGASARFWTNRLSRMLWIATGLGLVTGVVGALLSASFANLPAGPIIVLTGTSFFVFSVLFGTQRGFVVRWVTRRRNERELLAMQLPPLADVGPASRGDLRGIDFPSHDPGYKSSPATAKQTRPTPRVSKPKATRLPWLLPAAYFAAVLGLAALWLWRMHGLGVSTNTLAYDLGTITIGIVGNASCAILGCYLVLRRMSLLGDAIAHSVLPGLVAAYLLSGQTYGPPIFLGAMVMGLVTSFLTQSLHTWGKVAEDASIGVVFTSLFALGVIMIETLAKSAHLDDCVIDGQLEYAWYTSASLFGWEMPRAMASVGPALALVLLFVAVFWKELKIVAFDPALAAAMGFRVMLVHYLLMAMVAGVTVSAFESLGSILVVAMLIVPAATAAMMTERLWSMMLWSVLFASTSAIFGYLGAKALNTNAAGMTAVVAGIQFGGAVLLAPRQGLVSRWLRRWSLAVRIAAEDILGRLFRAEEARDRGREIFGDQAEEGWLARLARWQLARRGYVEAAGDGLRLTARGRSAAQNLVRAHRLWESFLETHFELPADHLHEPAERMEHFLGDELQAEIDAELAGRHVDPHGKEIPSAAAK